MKKTILLSGGSGFLGSRIARLLLAQTDCDIVAIVRGGSQEEAERRIARLWADWPEAVEEIGARVRILRGDLGDALLGLPDEEYRRLVATVTHVIHSAAELDLDGPIEKLRHINVGGTSRLLELARAAHRDHGLERFGHVSTAYVAGKRTGDVAEGELSDFFGFSNAYEQTKYEGERLVRFAMGELPISIFRPGMVVGDSETGEIQTFNTIYIPLRLYLTGRLKLVPARPELRVNLVPVDYVTQAIVRLTFHPKAVGRTFHLVVDSKHLPGAKEVIELARSWAAENLSQELPRPRFVPFERVVGLVEARLFNIPSFLISYFNEHRRYLRENVDRLLGPYEPDWAAILPRLFDYANVRGFLHRTGRTVHEQLLVRLRSRSLPLRVHDLARGERPHLRSGEEICNEIRTARRSLEVLGVQPRDRVALVGYNSSRYLSLDVALGLAGAVSVPLYYTTPPEEIEATLRVSGARLLFVGTRELLASLAGMGPELTVVSFCRTEGKAAKSTALAGAQGSPGGPTAGGPEARALSWEAFLALAGNEAPGTVPKRSAPEEFEAHTDLSDIATIRFTSGTTGAPKGVTFRHGQLEWMAQTLVSLLPWKGRISGGRYLSFLPMNHVVEGILGTYAPAFMPAPVDLYFLEDIHALPDALRSVRPTVFFSVPRFYEKLWERFSRSLAGGLYQTAGAGALRNMARPIVRRALLRKAGLDGCMQLIVGSAACSDRLAGDFRELGIELHNAYGLTEAPLVTINRFGANRIGTVGTPLPETELRIGADGEVFVRGPQVTAGYWPEATVSPRTDGWLATGDLGSVDSEGGLSIDGRKKDVLVTSYGKNIQASKIEGMLRSIPGVMEAVVLGDSRPAVCGLLWLAGQTPGPGELRALDRAVEGVNERLSHPERLKRWAVLAERPSIDNAELTGNMKIKRETVAARRAPVVALLYEDMAARGGPSKAAPPELGVLHVGRRDRECA